MAILAPIAATEAVGLIPVVLAIGGLVYDHATQQDKIVGSAISNTFKDVFSLSGSSAVKASNVVGAMVAASRAQAEHAADIVTGELIGQAYQLINADHAAYLRFAKATDAAIHKIVTHDIPSVAGHAAGALGTKVTELDHTLSKLGKHVTAEVNRIDHNVAALTRRVTADETAAAAKVLGQTVTATAGTLSDLSTWTHAMVGNLAAKEASDVTALQSSIATLGEDVTTLQGQVAAVPGEIAAGIGAAIPANWGADIGATSAWIAANGAAAVVAGAFVAEFAYTDALTMSQCLQNWCNNASALLGLLGDAAGLALLEALMATAGIDPGTVVSQLGDIVGDVGELI